MELYKLSGAGNDFLALVEPDANPSTVQIRAWCRRAVSIGADGVFVLRRLGASAAGQPAVRMEHFNPDGGRAELCLNGSRCAARLAFELGWAEGALELQTDSGPLAARATHAQEPGHVALALPEGLAGTPQETVCEVDGSAHRGWALRVGVPHLVVPWPGSLAMAPVAALGPRLRAHPALGDDGANVHFVRELPPDRLEIRSFERGVEAETLACGTGAVAAAVVATSRGLLQWPVTAWSAGGFELGIARRGGSGLELAGDARLVARVHPLGGADEVPIPAVWSPADAKGLRGPEEDSVSFRKTE